MSNTMISAGAKVAASDLPAIKMLCVALGASNGQQGRRPSLCVMMDVVTSDPVTHFPDMAVDVHVCDTLSGARTAASILRSAGTDDTSIECGAMTAGYGIVLVCKSGTSGKINLLDHRTVKDVVLKPSWEMNDSDVRKAISDPEVDDATVNHHELTRLLSAAGASTDGVKLQQLFEESFKRHGQAVALSCDSVREEINMILAGFGPAPAMDSRKIMRSIRKEMPRVQSMVRQITSEIAYDVISGQ